MVVCKDFITVHKTPAHNIYPTNVIQSPWLQQHGLMDHSFFMAASLGLFTMTST